MGAPRHPPFCRRSWLAPPPPRSLACRRPVTPTGGVTGSVPLHQGGRTNGYGDTQCPQCPQCPLSPWRTLGQVLGAVDVELERGHARGEWRRLQEVGFHLLAPRRFLRLLEWGAKITRNQKLKKITGAPQGGSQGAGWGAHRRGLAGAEDGQADAEVAAGSGLGAPGVLQAQPLPAQPETCRGDTRVTPSGCGDTPWAPTAPRRGLTYRAHCRWCRHPAAGKQKGRKMAKMGFFTPFPCCHPHLEGSDGGLGTDGPGVEHLWGWGQCQRPPHCHCPRRCHWLRPGCGWALLPAGWAFGGNAGKTPRIGQNCERGDGREGDTGGSPSPGATSL